MGVGAGIGFFKPLITSVLLLPALAACASLQGAPQPVIGVAQRLALAATYDVVPALKAFDDDPNSAGPDDHGVADLRRGLSREQYRNMVVTIYLMAADARYNEWRAALSDERRELGLGFDSSVIGMTGVAAVSRQSWVRSLTAAASIMAGLRGATERNVYFDRTLPGLLASMDAQRIRIRTQILDRLDETAVNYPLAMAFADISNYESAASIDAAIEDITAQASADRQAAQREYAAAVHACHSTEDLRANRAKIFGWLRNAARTNDELRAFAGLVPLQEITPTPGLALQIERALRENYCTNAQLESLISAARQQTWGKDAFQ